MKKMITTVALLALLANFGGTANAQEQVQNDDLAFAQRDGGKGQAQKGKRGQGDAKKKGEAKRGDKKRKGDGRPPRGKDRPTRKELIKKYDTNSNGKLDPAERKKLDEDRKARTGAGKKHRLSRKEMLKRFDKNNDGKLDETERKAARSAHEKRVKKADAEKKGDTKKRGDKKKGEARDKGQEPVKKP